MLALTRWCQQREVGDYIVGMQRKDTRRLRAVCWNAGIRAEMWRRANYRARIALERGEYELQGGLRWQKSETNRGRGPVLLEEYYISGTQMQGHMKITCCRRWLAYE